MRAIVDPWPRWQRTRKLSSRRWCGREMETASEATYPRRGGGTPWTRQIIRRSVAELYTLFLKNIYTYIEIFTYISAVHSSRSWGLTKTEKEVSNLIYFIQAVPQQIGGFIAKTYNSELTLSMHFHKSINTSLLIMFWQAVHEKKCKFWTWFLSVDRGACTKVCQFESCGKRASIYSSSISPHGDKTRGGKREYT